MKKQFLFVLVLILLSSFAISFEGSTKGELAEDALDKLYHSNSGTEFKSILEQIESDPLLKVEVLEKMSLDVKGHAAKGLIPTGTLNLVFTDANGKEVDPYFKVNSDKSIADFGTGTAFDPDYTVYFDESLFQEVRNSKNQVATLANAIDSGRIKIKSNRVVGKYNIVVIRFLGRAYIMLSPIIDPIVRIFSPPAPTNSQSLCIFSNIVGGKKVTCSLYKAADTFCGTSMSAPGTNKIAKSLSCSDSEIVCAMPCGTTNVRCATGGTLSQKTCSSPIEPVDPYAISEKCPLFCSYGPVSNYGSSGLINTYPDCDVKDFSTCAGEAHTGIDRVACTCQKAKPSATACPETCEVSYNGAQARCWVDARVKGKTGNVCAGHVYGLGNWQPYQKAPDQPACICG